MQKPFCSFISPKKLGLSIKVEHFALVLHADLVIENAILLVCSQKNEKLV